jgi:PiT family inorganic phosphate transporter
VLGSGVGKPGAEVRWGVAGRMATAWAVTLPSAGIVGAISYLLVHSLGGYLGVIVGFTLLSAAALAIWLRSRKVRVDHTNVNSEWEGGLTAGLPTTNGRPPTPETAPQRTTATSDAGPLSNVHMP